MRVTLSFTGPPGRAGTPHRHPELVSPRAHDTTVLAGQERAPGPAKVNRLPLQGQSRALATARPHTTQSATQKGPTR